MNDISRAKINGTIQFVRGRQAAGGERGLPKITEMVIKHEDGRTLSSSVLPKGVLKTAEGICTITAGQFEFCPICYENEANSSEHVPPKAFGGRVMATTCERCNNTFGSRTEAAMQDWFDRAIRAYFSVSGKLESFGHVRLIELRTDSDEFILIPERGSDPGASFAERMAANATLEMHSSTPRPEEYRNGMLKSAYLAASLHIGGVPNVPSANEIRAELQAVVRAKKRSDVTLGKHGEALAFYRTGKPSDSPPLALLKVVNPTGKAEYLISLAGTILVDWPFPEINPELTHRR